MGFPSAEGTTGFLTQPRKCREGKVRQTESASADATRFVTLVLGEAAYKKTEGLKRSHLHAQYLRHRRKVQAPAGLVAIPYADRMKHAILIGTFLRAKKLALLSGCAVGNAKINAAEESRNQKFVFAKLCDEGASGGFRISRRIVSRPERWKSIRNHCLPCAEIERLRRLARLLGNALQHALEIETRNLAVHGTNEFVVQRKRRQ